MKQIQKRKGVQAMSYMLQYLDAAHELFSICKYFRPGKFTVKAVNGRGTYESVIAVCRTKQLARQVIEQDLNGKVI